MARRSVNPVGFIALALGAFALQSGCASGPRGADYPRPVTVALAHPESTRLGSTFLDAASERGQRSGFRLLPVGIDGLLAREEMIDAAERTVDLQYYIFRGDETGRLLSAAVLRAADRGVRVRILVDDGETVSGDEQLFGLDGHPGVEIRIFNPFDYRGHLTLFRALDFLFHKSRLDYRMHNKLLVVDNAAALVGGRNVANEYFQVDPRLQYADEEVFAVGPVVTKLSGTFDDFWNSGLAIPAKALEPRSTTARARAVHGTHSWQNGPVGAPDVTGIDYTARAEANEPFAGLVSGRLPLTWAPAEVVADSPFKREVEAGARRGRLMAPAVLARFAAVQRELEMITPYFVPSRDELETLAALRSREVRVRLLTTSLDASDDIVTQAAYERARKPLLAQGVEIHELRAKLGDVRGSGEPERLARFGHYSLHAKLFVFDDDALFIGSMNLDQRSKHLNTEIGLIISSADLARQVAGRFDAMSGPEEAYAVTLQSREKGDRPEIVWTTQVEGRLVSTTREPTRHPRRRFAARLLSWLPIRGEL